MVFLRAELVWFVQTLQIDNETTPECRMLATGMKTRAHRVARELDQIDEDARRGGIYPGAMRDLKRQLWTGALSGRKKRPLGLLQAA